MKFSAFLPFAAVVYGAPSVEVRQNPTSCHAATGDGSAWNTYEIKASIPDADAPGICGGLWDNLNSWPCSPSDTSCGSSNGAFTWKFVTPLGCNQGMIESVWWEATRNTWGALFCI
ncbi:hypothetical protein HJFPF1_05502 [Paramyrothecium foliicola]|nr:hypothetical protein HJFPF1_05502 [Paramyrothecium foliicola]